MRVKRAIRLLSSRPVTGFPLQASASVVPNAAIQVDIQADGRLLCAHLRAVSASREAGHPGHSGSDAAFSPKHGGSRSGHFGHGGHGAKAGVWGHDHCDDDGKRPQREGRTGTSETTSPSPSPSPRGPPAPLTRAQRRAVP